VLQADYDPRSTLNDLLPFLRALIVLTITRRVAAGWLVLPFQGERMTVNPQTENAPG
jgi:hypothetical protein